MLAPIWSILVVAAAQDLFLQQPTVRLNNAVMAGVRCSQWWVEKDESSRAGRKRTDTAMLTACPRFGLEG